MQQNFHILYSAPSKTSRRSQLFNLPPALNREVKRRIIADVGNCGRNSLYFILSRKMNETLIQCADTDFLANAVPIFYNEIHILAHLPCCCMALPLLHLQSMLENEKMRKKFSYFKRLF
jgi:hypothetical protein